MGIALLPHKNPINRLLRRRRIGRKQQQASQYLAKEAVPCRES
jgi:hypothetical protein